MEFTVAAEQKVKIKKRKERQIDVAIGLRKLSNMRETVILVVTE